MDLLTKLRERQGSMTQAQMAGRLGIGRSTYTRMMNGSRRPGAWVLSRVLAVYPSLVDDVSDYLAARTGTNGDGGE